MATEGRGLIVVCGATGRQGGAVVRHLIADGWAVRGLTRNPDAPKAKALSDLGVEVVQADMGERDSMQRAVAGAAGVFSVQNPMISGSEAEVAQGKTVADAAQASGVRHVVYGSAGLGTPTGVPSWDSKIAVADHMRQLGLPLTVLRPMAFMELMSDKGYFPPVSVWHLMPKLMGPDRPLPWLSVDDIGAIAAKAFADPETFIGADIALASDVRTLDECRATWQESTGRRPRGFPMPLWLFRRFVGDDLPIMWRWLRTGTVPLDTEPTRRIHPAAVTVGEWVRKVARGAGEQPSAA
jgi:uncharacterized protein YbjT (DUF2867 family)